MVKEVGPRRKLTKEGPESSLKRTQRRRLVWQGWCRNMSVEEIADELKVNKSTVLNDLRAIDAAFRERFLGDIQELKLRETAALQDMADQVLQDYLMRGRSARTAAVWLDIRNRIQDLWGLKAPQKIAPTTPDGNEPYTPDGDTLASRIDSIAARLRAATSAE